MSILQQVIEEYGISETCRGLTDKTDKRASVSSVSDCSTDSDLPDVMPHEERVAQEMLEIMAMRQRGVTPPHYTAVTECNHCGPVPIWEGCPPQVMGCPWCFNRLKGLPIPEAK